MPKLVSTTADVSFCRPVIFASMLLRLDVTVPRLVCMVATPLLMLEMLELSELTDAVTCPMLVWSVAKLPFIEVTTALIAVRLAVIEPVAVWIVATVPLMLVTLAPMPNKVELIEFTVVFVCVTVLLIAVSKPVVEVNGSASTVKFALAAGPLAPLPSPTR